MRKWREENKELDAYRNLQTSARKRKLPFLITFEDFLEIIEGTEYIEKKGNGPKNLTIDRDDNLLGYVLGNCFVRTKRANVQKFHKKDIKRNNNGSSKSSSDKA